MNSYRFTPQSRPKSSTLRRLLSNLVGLIRVAFTALFGILFGFVLAAFLIGIRLLGIAVVVVIVALVLRWLGLVSFTLPW